MGGVRLAICDYEILLAEAPGTESPSPLSWNGVVLSINVDSRQAVDEVPAVAAGARDITAPVQRDWGGYSGYVTDPEAHRWEIAWAPGAAQ
jgi:uncharacterized glyoxalase superfamily protein PhnB